MKFSWFIVFIIILQQACIEPYEFEGVDEDNLLIVDGYITNELKSHKIRLTRTQNFSNYRNEPVTGAYVAITDDLGNEEVLLESDNGYYLTSQNFSALQDRTYRLEVTISDGEVVISDPVQLVHGESPENLVLIPGIREYYRRDGELRLEEFVEILLEIPSTNSDQDLFYKWDIHPQWITFAELAPPQLEWCYIQDRKLRAVSTWHDDISKSKEGIQTISLTTTPYDHRMKFDLRIHVSQLSMNRSGFDYWTDIKKQRESTGSIFDPIPNSVQGNMRNKLDNGKGVLGHFGVFSADSLILHVNQSDLPFDELPPIDCTPVLGEFPPRCLDCTAYTGGEWVVPVKPEWWDD